MINEDQAKGQKKESVHTIKMKFDELQVMDDAENKTMMIEKVVYVPVCLCMCAIRGKQ